MDKLNSISIGSLTLGDILMAVVYLIICIIVIRILQNVAKRVLDKSKLDPAIRGFLHTGIDIILWVIAIIIVCGKLGIETASLVAVVSIAGLALSLSLQNILGNLFSGFTVIGTHPFSIGDVVEIGGTAGAITKIGLFYTTLTTLDNRVIHIPNSDVISSRITNASANPLRRNDVVITAAYTEDTEAVKKALLDAAAAVPVILTDPAPVAMLSEYRNSSIAYILRYWTKSGDYLGGAAAVTEAVRKAFADNGVSMTYDHINVHIDNK